MDMDMDMSSMWLPELEMEDQHFMYRYDKLSKLYDTIDNLTADSFSSESYIANECFIDKSFQTPSRAVEHAEMKLQISEKANIPTRSQTLTNFSTSTLSSNTFTITFGDLKLNDEIRPLNDSLGNGKLKNMAKTEVQAQEHVLAERKRRERLNQYFISMSSLLPNLKKMDKASVLEDAANYIRELEDRVKDLEGLSGVTWKGAREYNVVLKRSRLSDNDERVVPYKSSADIEVRMSGSSVLCRIQSQKDSSLLTKALSKMQKLGLSVISSNTMPFANTITLVTIVAQIEDDFFMTPTDIVRDLQLLL